MHDGSPKDSNGAASDTYEYAKKQPRHLPTKPTAHHPWTEGVMRLASWVKKWVSPC